MIAKPIGSVLGLCALVLLSSTAAAQQQASSARIERLLSDVAAGRPGVVGAFWDEVARDGAPLVEPTDDGRLLVTFLWRGGSELGPVAVFSAATGWTQPSDLLAWLPGTDVWHGTFAVPRDARFTYRISVNDNLRTYYLDPDFRERAAAFRADPLNPDTVGLGGTAIGSLFEGPDALTSDLLERRPASPRGRVVDVALTSEALQGSRAVRVYLPPGFDRSGPEGGYPLLVVLDGNSYTSTVPTPAILDNLHALNRLPGVVAAFVEPENRGRELSANDDFTRFLADELVPEMRRRYNAGIDRSETTIAGSSLGGLAAAYAALTKSDAFGAVLAQSGAFWWAPEGTPEPGWLMRAYAAGPRLPLRFYLEVGRLETEPIRGGPSMLQLSRHMRDVLCAKGYPVQYRETGGDHAYVTWRHSFGEAIQSIAIPDASPSANGVSQACSLDRAEPGLP